MSHVAALPRLSLLRWARGRRAAYQPATAVGPKPLLRKDFSVVPVCGSVRPSAAQRRLGPRP